MGALTLIMRRFLVILFFFPQFTFTQIIDTVYYGIDGIPKEWVDIIYDRDLILDYADKIYEINKVGNGIKF